MLTPFAFLLFTLRAQTSLRIQVRGAIAGISESALCRFQSSSIADTSTSAMARGNQRDKARVSPLRNPSTHPLESDCSSDKQEKTQKEAASQKKKNTVSPGSGPSGASAPFLRLPLFCVCPFLGN